MKIDESIANIDDLGGIKSILYVEDNPANRKLMQLYIVRFYT